MRRCWGASAPRQYVANKKIDLGGFGGLRADLGDLGADLGSVLSGKYLSGKVGPPVHNAHNTCDPTQTRS